MLRLCHKEPPELLGDFHPTCLKSQACRHKIFVKIIADCQHGNVSCDILEEVSFQRQIIYIYIEREKTNRRILDVTDAILEDQHGKLTCKLCS